MSVDSNACTTSSDISCDKKNLVFEGRLITRAGVWRKRRNLRVSLRLTEPSHCCLSQDFGSKLGIVWKLSQKTQGCCILHQVATKACGWPDDHLFIQNIEAIAGHKPRQNHHWFHLKSLVAAVVQYMVGGGCDEWRCTDDHYYLFPDVFVTWAILQESFLLCVG